MCQFASGYKLHRKRDTPFRVGEFVSIMGENHRIQYAKVIGINNDIVHVQTYTFRLSSSDLACLYLGEMPTVERRKERLALVPLEDDQFDLNKASPREHLWIPRGKVVKRLLITDGFVNKYAILNFVKL